MIEGKNYCFRCEYFDGGALSECQNCIGKITNYKPKQFKGWELLKLIDQELVNDGEIITAHYEDVKAYCRYKEKDKTIVNEKDEVISCFILANLMFSFKAKKYLTFTEAIKTNKRIKHKDDNRFRSIRTVLGLTLNMDDEDIIKSLTEKVWEVEP